MDNANANGRVEILLDELLEDLERQKTDLEMLREQILSDNSKTSKTALELQKAAIKKIKEFEEALKAREHTIAELQEIIQKQEIVLEDMQAQDANDLACQEECIDKLTKAYNEQKQEIERLHELVEEYERVARFVKVRCHKAVENSVGKFGWKYKRYHAILFLDLVSLFFLKLNIFNEEEKKAIIQFYYPEKKKQLEKSAGFVQEGKKNNFSRAFARGKQISLLLIEYFRKKKRKKSESAV